MEYAITFINKQDKCWLQNKVKVAVRPKPKMPKYFEWGWTARIAIARHAIARHFWQEINCSTRNWQTVRIKLILVKPDSNRWRKYCKLLESGFYLIIFHVEHKTNIIFFIKLLEFSTLDKNIFILCRAERCRVFKARPLKRINLLEFVTFDKI
jgi:hypothetical protein